MLLCRVVADRLVESQHKRSGKLLRDEPLDLGFLASVFANWRVGIVVAVMAAAAVKHEATGQEYGNGAQLYRITEQPDRALTIHRMAGVTFEQTPIDPRERPGDE